MNNLICLFIGFMLGIIVSIAFKFICSRNSRRRQRVGNMIVPRRTIQITSGPIYLDTESESDNYSISVEEDTLEESKEESKKELSIRIPEIV